ncbi:MAG: hypothetical protein FWC70_05500 [Defluviitaleaceae bacterium]|nr:hypothetical protein [Defluviitaleaceae bacterium]
MTDFLDDIAVINRYSLSEKTEDEDGILHLSNAKKRVDLWRIFGMGKPLRQNNILEISLTHSNNGIDATGEKEANRNG